MNNIQQQNQKIVDNINKSFISDEQKFFDLSGELVKGEIYTEQALNFFISDINKAFLNNEISLDDFEKAKKDLSRLAMRQVIDKNGHKRIVYVKVQEDEHGKTKETEFDKDQSVKFTKDGKELSGTIKSLKFHDKTDKVGTALVDVDGKNYSVSLAKLEHYDTKKETKEDNKKEVENKQPDITAKQAFADIQSLNPSTSTISSLGTFVSSQNQQLADAKAKEIMGYLPKESLAYKIVSSANKFSDKQLWVIAYELVKNKEYQKDLAESIKEAERYAAYQKARKSAKRAAKSSAKKQAKEAAANAMKQYEDIDSDDKVKHPIFGEGKVISQTDDKIKILFKNVGEKELLKKFAKLEFEIDKQTDVSPKDRMALSRLLDNKVDDNLNKNSKSKIGFLNDDDYKKLSKDELKEHKKFLDNAVRNSTSKYELNYKIQPKLDVVNLLLDKRDSGEIKEQISGAKKGATASGGGHGPYTKTGNNSWKSTTGILMNDDLLQRMIGGFRNFKIDDISDEDYNKDRKIKLGDEIRGWSGNDYTDSQINSVIDALKDASITDSDIKIGQKSTPNAQSQAIQSKVKELSSEIQNGNWHKDLNRKGVEEILDGIIRTRLNGTSIMSNSDKNFSFNSKNIKNDIEKAFEIIGLLSENDLEKGGKKATIGEIRDWNDI